MDQFRDGDMTGDEWVAAVVHAIQRRCEGCDPPSVMAETLESGVAEHGRLLVLAWRAPNGGRFGRRHAIPIEQAIRNAMTAEYVAYATLDQWGTTWGEVLAAQQSGAQPDA